MFRPQMENDCPTPGLGALHGKLRHTIPLVLHLYIQPVVRKNVARALKNGGQLASLQPVLNIIVHPHLQQAALLLTARSAAVDEPLGDVTHFRDVEMRRNQRAVRKPDGNVGAGPRLEVLEEFSDYHN